MESVWIMIHKKSSVVPSVKKKQITNKSEWDFMTIHTLKEEPQQKNVMGPDLFRRIMFLARQTVHFLLSDFNSCCGSFSGFGGT